MDGKEKLEQFLNYLRIVDKQINACSSFEELEAKLKGEIAETQDNAILYDLQRQLNLISEYLISVEKTVSANDEFGGFKKR